MNPIRTTAGISTIFASVLSSVSFGQTASGPVPYLNIEDSPYFSGGQVCYALETFPNGEISVPGLSFSNNGAAIVAGAGVPPGGFVLQASTLGVIELNISPDPSTGLYPTQVGFVWTGGGVPQSLASVSLTAIAGGTLPFNASFSNLPYNDPDNPDDNVFFGVSWSLGIQQLRIAFNPFFGIENQIDDIQFTLAPKVLAVEPDSVPFSAAGGTGSSAVTMNGVSCEWTSSTVDSWITLTNSGGFGNGPLEFSVEPNAGAARSGSIVVNSAGGSIPIVITQEEPCSVTGVDPTSQNIPAAGGFGSFTVSTSGPDCTWTAQTPEPWITLTGESGIGSGQVSYSVATNSTTSPRTGVISVDGLDFTVNQAAAAGNQLTASGPVPYLNIEDSPYFSGGQVCYALETFPNGEISVPGLSFSNNGAAIVAGAGVPPGGFVLQASTFGVIELNISPDPSTGLYPTQVGFVWTGGGVPQSLASVTLTAIAGGTLPFNASFSDLPYNDPENPDDNVFFGVSWSLGIQQLRIAFNPFFGIENQIDDIQFTLAPKVLAVEPDSVPFSAAGGTGSSAVTMNGVSCEWTSSTADSWITLTNSGGFGNGPLEFSVEPNAGAARSGSIVVNSAGGSIPIVITQSAAGVCTVTSVDPPSADFDAVGGSVSFTVSTSGPDCEWTAESLDPWITLTGASGIGGGQVECTVEPNAGAARIGSIVVNSAGGSIPIVITQEEPCSVTGVDPTSQNIPAAGGFGSFTVSTSGPDCTWTAQTPEPWITLTGESGIGSGQVSYSVATNSTTSPRTGVISVDGLDFTVNQAAAAGVCTVTGVDPPSADFDAVGGSVSFTVSTSGPDCAWTAQTPDPWITLTGASGIGSGQVECTVEPNAGAARIGSIVVNSAGGSIPIVITQEEPCSVTGVDPTSQNIPAAGGLGSFTVSTSGPDCTWIAESPDPWITLDRDSGIGGEPCEFSVAANNTDMERTGMIVVGDIVFDVLQAPLECAVIGLSPTAATVPGSGGTGSFGVTTNGPECTWTAETIDSWIILTPPASGTGTSGVVNYMVDPNPSAEPRTGTILVGILSFLVEQDGSGGGAPIVVEPDTSYLSLADSPFFGSGTECFAVDFFPDGSQSSAAYVLRDGAIQPGPGVKPGGFVVEPVNGQLSLEFNPATIPGGELPTRVGLVWCGGGPGSAVITVTSAAGVEVSEVREFGTNDPANPSDNRFIGIEWSQRIRQVSAQFSESPVAYQFDQIQFDLPNLTCEDGRADFNGDGWDDLIVQNVQTGEVQVQMMLNGQGAGLIPIGEPRPSNWSIQAIGAWSGGGNQRPSIAWRNFMNGELWGWRLNGSTFEEQYRVLPTVWIGWDLIGSGDLNGDGVTEFVWRNDDDGRVGYWIMGDDGQPTSWTVFPNQVSIAWDLVGIGDFNADGSDDLLWQNLGNQQMGVWYLGEGFAISSLGVLTWNAPPGGVVAGVADFDNDGVSDILWSLAASVYRIWFMQPEGASGSTLNVREVTDPLLDVGDQWRANGN